MTITTATSNAACTGTPAVCLPSADSSTLAANTIIAALNAGTSVTVQTTNPAGTEAGNILVGSGPVDGTISGFNAPSAVTLTLNAGSGGGAGGITVNSPISDSGSTGALSVVLTAGGDITLDNSVTIGATLIATAGPAAAVNINSGGAIAAAGGLALAAGSGGISLVDNVTASGETVTLSSAGAISQTGGVITAGNLAITAAGSVGLPAANSVTTLAASVTGSGNGIIFRDASTPLSVGTVGSVAGISTSDGRIAMSTTTSGNVTVKSAITSTGGEIDIATAPGSGFINSAAIGSGGGDIVLLGDTLALAGAGATVNAGTGAVVLGPATTTRNIVLGAASNGTTLGLQSTDFATITAGMVEVGYRAEDATASFTGDISVGGGAGISLNPTGFPALLLVTGGPGGTVKQTQSVNFTGPRGTLGVIAGGKVSLTLSNAVDTLAGFADNSSAFAFSNSHALAVGALPTQQLGISVDPITGLASSAAMGTGAGKPSSPLTGVTASAPVALTTTMGGLTLGAGVTASGETVTLSSAGAITQTAAGVITAATLTGSSFGAVDLSTASNAISALGAFTPGGDFKLNNGATALQFTGAFAGAGDTLTLTAGPITQTAAGGIMAATLTGSSSGAVDLSTASNAIGALGAFTPGDDFKLNNGATALQLTGAFAGAGNTLTLKTGPISQTPAGVITAATLTGSSSGAVDLSTASNAISALGAFTPGGKFKLNDGVTALQFTGAFAGAGDTLTLTAGPINQIAAGVITAAALTGSSSGAVDLSTASNAIGALGAFTPGGDFKLNNGATALQFTGAFAGAGDALTLTTGPISQTAAGVITAATLTGSSSGAVDLSTASNAIGALGAFTPGGDFRLNDGATALQFSGAFAGTGDTLTLTAGPITQTAAGVITAATLTGSSSGAVDLSTASNAISALGAFTPGGDFKLNDGATALQFTGAFAGAGNTLTLTAGPIAQIAAGVITAATLTGSSSGAVDLSTASNAIGALGAFTPGGEFKLNDGATALQFTGAFAGAGDTLTLSAGPISQTAAGVITAATFTGSSSGAVDLSTASNAIGALGAFTPGGDFKLNDGATALQFTGAFAGAGDTLTLTAGPITQTAGGVITAATITGSATSANLTQLGNLVGTLGAFSTSAGFALTDNQALLVTGPVIDAGAASTLALTTKTGDITLTGTVTAINLVDLISAGAINQTAGTLIANVLTGSAATSASLTKPVNLVGTLGAFSTTAGFALTDDQPLLVNGPVVDTGATSALALTSKIGDITLAGTVHAANIVNLISAGTISQTGDRLIAGTLTGSAAGSASLAQPANQVGTLNGFNADGFALDNSSGLTVLGTVSGGPTATVANKGPLTINGTVTAQVVSITADSIGIPGNVTGTSVALYGTVGAITETGLLNASTLTGSAVTTAGLTGTSFSNSITTLNGFTAAGFTLDNGIGLTVLGTLSGGPSATIADTGPLAVNGTVSATAVSLTADSITIPGNVKGNTVALFGTVGAISETGVLIAGTLTGSATTSASLTQQGNQIGTREQLHGVRAVADRWCRPDRHRQRQWRAERDAGWRRNDHRSRRRCGQRQHAQHHRNRQHRHRRARCRAPTASRLVSNTGSITETGTLITDLLTGSAAGDASLTGTGGEQQVVQLGSFTSGGTFTLDDGIDLTITGPLSAPTIVIDTGANTLTLADQAIITTGGTARPPGTVTTFPGDRRLPPPMVPS